MPLQENKKSFLGGSILLKVLILIAVIVIASIVIFGVKLAIWDIFFTVLKILFALVLLYFVYLGFSTLFAPKPFSPTGDFKSKLIRVSELSKPFNVKKLFLRGEDMRVHSYWGDISGLAFIPYLSSSPVKNDKGKTIMVEKRDKDGVLVLGEDKKPVLVPQMAIVNEKDGEWLFVTKRGLFGKKDLVRAHNSLVSEIGETVWIKDVNLVPIGDFFYPAKQWQKDIQRILAQHQTEAVIQTHENFLDLVSHTTEMSIGMDPTYRKIRWLQSEAITNGPTPVVQQ